MSQAESRLVEYTRLDQVQLFMFYALLGGDLPRVSAATRVPEDVLASLAHDFNWKTKLSGKNNLLTDEGKAAQRDLNRVVSLVTAERMHNVIANLVAELDKDPQFARSFCTEVDAETKEVSFSTKNLVELTKAMQVIHELKYRALGDKVATAADGAGATPAAAGNVVFNIYNQLQRRFDRTGKVDMVVEAAKAVTEINAPVK